jgi:hypothetical protein
MKSNTRRSALVVGLECVIAFALALAIVCSLAIIRAHAQQHSTFTDREGRFAGSSATRGNQTDISDRSGRFSGSSITRGNKTDFFDANGRYQGTTTQQQPGK